MFFLGAAVNLQDILADIHTLEEELLQFEKKYGVRCETFYAVADIQAFDGIRERGGVKLPDLFNDFSRNGLFHNCADRENLWECSSRS